MMKHSHRFSLRSLISTCSRPHSLLCRQPQSVRHIHHFQPFTYGSNEPQLLQLELCAHQHELHGEDSLFMYDNSSFGVADGVGGWNGVQGGNPKEFSRRIMENCKSELDAIVNDPEGDGNAYINSKELLVRASTPVINDESLLGGSTALVGMIIDQNILSVANIGDSRFYLFRRFPDRSVPVLYFISPEQRYSFNAPMQLSPRAYLEKSALAVDPAKWTEYYELPVTHGDIIVFVTDGVSDNLFPHELNQLVIDLYKKHSDSERKLSENIAKGIVRAAVDKQEGVSNIKEAPFGTPKPDDTTVVVGVCVNVTAQ